MTESIGDYPYHQKEIDVNIQSQTSPLFQYFLQTHAQDDIKLSTDALKDTSIISVNAGHGITVGDSLVIREGDMFEQTLVTLVSVNDITVEMPLQATFTTDSIIVRGSRNIAIDGLTTPTTFLYDPTISGKSSPLTPIDISYLVITMRHAAEGDDSKFGSLESLPLGTYLRKVDGSTTNLGNYKINQDFVDRGWEYTQREKSGGGEFSTTLELDLIKIFTQESRFNPRLPDVFKLFARDKMDGLISFTFSIIGSFTSGE